MDRFHLMSVFVAVAEEEGFAAAARRLSMSPPAVTRAITALESRLGIRLLNRTTRFVRTTEAGKRYLDDARRVLSDLDAADEAAIGINAEPRGTISITAPMLFGRLFVLPGVVEYLDRFQETQVSAVFLDRVVNLLEEGFDVGVRIGELPDSSLRALRVGSVRTVVVGSPEYLKKNGTPRIPEQLGDHTLLTIASSVGAQSWRFEKSGEKYTVRAIPRLSLTTNDAAVEATVQGFGISRLLSYQVAPALAAGKLIPLLEDFEPAAKPIHIIHREGRVQSAKVRAFVDLMAERLRTDAAINP